MITPELIAVARGDAPADLLLINARVINVFTGEITGPDAAVSIHDNRIACIGPRSEAQRTIDLRGSFVAPGFIDAHMHVESTLLPPSQFVRLAAPHGTTGVILDPHEIANVLGLDGIRYLMDDARGLPINALFALSSCVPASHLENSGARLDAHHLEELFSDPRVVALAEMMNFPGVVNADPGVLAKINLGLRHRVVDGHSPGLRGRALQAYAAAGISSDHECTTADEAIEKIRLGMRVFIREGSAARNLRAILPAVNTANQNRFSFCTDDRHPADLETDGHIDHVVREAVRLGLDPLAAIAMGSLYTAQHYRQRDLGAVAPGFKADMIVFDDLRDIRPRMVLHHGLLVAQGGQYIAPPPSVAPTPSPRSALQLHALLGESSFAIAARAGVTNIRVIGMDPHQLVTASLSLPPCIDAGRYVSDVSRDILKLAVIERHRATGNIGLGFVRGFGLRAGALASTVGHDSHNLAIAGCTDADMLAAARELERVGGGQCAVLNGKVLATLPLPIAGLMSDQPAAEVIRLQRLLLQASAKLGCPHHDPFMPLSFLPLPVIPHLKLTDLGLVDVNAFAIVPLEC